MDLPAAGGILLVDKPAGPTSHDVVARARRALGTPRVGHTGTLDPFATGLLVLCIGPATRLVEFLVGLPKDYLARVRLGIRTTTDDPEGEVEATSESWRGLEREDALAGLEPLRGRSVQTPPRFSAKKIAGEAAHYRARRGETVVLEPVEINVLALDLLDWSPPELELRVRCSSGTYIRALARDLGERLGTGAHLSALRRTAVGDFGLVGAITADEMEDPDRVARGWITPAAALGHLPHVEVGPEDAARLAHGQMIPLASASAESEVVDGPVVVFSASQLVAVVEREGDHLRPRKVFQAAS